MISKRIVPASWFRDFPTAHLIKVHSRGMDKTAGMQKWASDYIMQMDIRPEKGYSFVHLITTGAGEYYGPNNNADYFNEKCASFEIPNHHRTGKPFEYQLKGGLTHYHPTFTKYGGIYREHHNSKKGGISQGDIFLEAYNPAMHRGELVVKLPNQKWATELNKLASGQPVFWSMGCGVPFDICSGCGKEAATREQYCNHLRYNKLSMTKEGHQIFAINDQPHFHDISPVAVPADRIAFALSKVASAGVHIDDLPPLYLPLSVIDKIGRRLEAQHHHTLAKLAEIEKKILVQGLTPDESNLSEAFSGAHLDEPTIRELQRYPLGDVINSCNKRGIMLPPKEFIRIVTKKPEGEICGLNGLSSEIKKIFSELTNSGDTEVASDASYVPMDTKHWTGLEDAATHIQGDLSVEDEPVRRRIVTVAIQGGHPQEKRAMLVEPTMNAESRVLAREYAKYQISFLTGIGADKYAHRVVVHNQVMDLT